MIDMCCSASAGLSASTSPHYATAAARAHTKDGLPSHISAFGDGSGDGFGDALDGSSAGATGGRVVDCLPDHLFSADGLPLQQNGALAVLSNGSDAKHVNGRAGGKGGEPGFAFADDMMASFKADAEGQWAAVAVANAGLADENEDELLAYNGEDTPHSESGIGISAHHVPPGTVDTDPVADRLCLAVLWPFCPRVRRQVCADPW